MGDIIKLHVYVHDDKKGTVDTMLYTGAHLNEIRFPLGGIGTGSVSIAGNGSLLDWEIFNRPDKGSFNGYSFFAIKAEYPCGKQVTKILQGDWTKDLIGQFIDSYGFGANTARMFGFPHFKKVKFEGKFPIAEITFEDADFPGKVIMRAFNPFIPLDSYNSSIPAAFFEVAVKSPEDGIKYTVLLCVKNLLGETVNSKLESDQYTAIQMKNATLTPEDVKYADLTVAVNNPNGIYQQYGYRGQYRDMITSFWHDVTHNTLKNRTYDEPGKEDTCLVGDAAVVDAGKRCSFQFVLTWNVPNFHIFWDPARQDAVWKNYYATQFADSAASCFYCLDRWDYLYGKTKEFCDSLQACSLDKAVVDAASANLSVLKTPTVLRLEDGTFYGWEGLFAQRGSCEGTCTHVWNYVYALCFLFPNLEQSLRTSELRYSMKEGGYLQYRSRLPLEGDNFKLPPCLDGQMGTVIKIYRDWKISGDTLWLKDHWETVKKLLEFAWSEENTNEWDRDKDGVLEGRQHHTLDVPLFGPSSWLESMYLTALKAGAEMAAFLGETDKQAEYMELFNKGYQWTKENLFNGSYFFHKINVSDKTPIDHFELPEYWNEERHQVKYQIDEGCQIDQMLGQWHANICGLGDIFDKEQRKTALRSMLKYNYKTSMRDVVNTWRIFALNDEAGAIICEYPEGARKPVIPISYVTECMTGFEYSFAGLLISEGMIEEGLELVRAVRDRFDGSKRNPFNEFECGSNYARSMASFALLPIFSGFHFDLPNDSIGFAPIIAGDFRCFWSLGTGWGDFIRKGSEYTVKLRMGQLTLKELRLGGIGKVEQVLVDGKQVAFTQNGNALTFDRITAKKALRIKTGV